MPEALAIFVGHQEVNAVGCQQVEKAGREVVGVGSRRNDVQGLAGGRSTSWYEVRLVVMVLKDQTEEVVAHPKVHGQLAGNFPVVVDVTSIIVLAIVRQ